MNVIFETKGNTATIDGVSVDLLDPFAPALVENLGTPRNANFRFRLPDAVSVLLFAEDGDIDDTLAFVRAFAWASANRGRIVVPGFGRTYDLVGTITVPSGVRVELDGRPVFNLVVAGNTRGFWFAPGTSDSSFRGDAEFNVSAATAGADGSYNGCFTWGQFYHVGDALPTRRCHVIGDILINCRGPANTKPVSMYGFTESCTVDGVRATGQTNFAFSAHWGSNGLPGVLPSKTWHLHRCEWLNCATFSTPTMGNLLRSFTVSAPGKFDFKNLTSDGALTLVYNLFVGDYGYTYAANVDEEQCFQLLLDRCDMTGGSTGLTVDCQSAGLNGSPIWTGSDHAAKVTIRNPMIRGDVLAIGDAWFTLAHLHTAVVENIALVEEGVTNNKNCIDVFGCRIVTISGTAKAQIGLRIRACGDVTLNGMQLSQVSARPDETITGVSASATSAAVTSVGAILAGATSITLTGHTIVTGPGGFLRYDDGVTVHEIEMLTTNAVGAGAPVKQSIQITPAPVAIPAGATLTMIQTVKKLTIRGGKISDYRTGIRVIGQEPAFVRDVTVDGVTFTGLGIYAVSMEGAHGFRVVNSEFEDNGRTTTSTDVRTIFVSGDSRAGIIANNKFGRRNQRARFHVLAEDGSDAVTINGNLFETLSATAVGAACVARFGTTNVVVPADSNINLTGKPLVAV